ncbi:alpha/beta hydrolase [Gaetbulibacter aestuarii]|uniref:Alpha/beta hydrolase n=1 Tax=Gaetbulibacter aestuarii TaxID=1502358 RepID=A0ABW7N253_9FLAO
MKRTSITIILLALLSQVYSFSQNETFVYKKIDTTSLVMQVFKPDSIDMAKKYPAMIFFFGGGWNKGKISQFEPHAKYFSKRGIVCFLADYRVKNRQQTTPFESLKDAKSAVRYIREHAKEFHIDPDKIIASGGSAGGQLAAATALIEGFNEDSDNLSFSCKPNALVLFNPVVDNGPGGVGYSRIDQAYKEFSPLHNIKKGAPPTIIFQGTEDYLIPVETIKYYQMVMEKVGSRCDVHFYDGRKHGFFNYRKFDNYKETVYQTDQFLQSLGYLEKDPMVEIK